MAHHLTVRAIVIGRVGHDDALLPAVGLHMLDPGSGFGLARQVGSQGDCVW